MRPGGVIIPIPIEDGDGIWTCGAAVWGKIASEPRRKEEHTRKGIRKRVDILIRTRNVRGENGEITRGKFQRCSINSDNVFFYVVNGAEMGDTFLLFGEYKERIYQTKRRRRDEYGRTIPGAEPERVEKMSRDFQIQFAIPAQAIVDPVSYFQRFSAQPDEHYSYQEDIGVTGQDDEETPGYDDWSGNRRW